MGAQAQIDPGNAPEDQSAAAQKAKAQEQKSKLGSKGGEKRIINNGKIEKGLGGPDTKTKGAEEFKKAGKVNKVLGGPDTKAKGAEAFKGGEKNAPSGEKATTKNSAAEKATVKGFNPPDPPGKGMKAGGIRTQPKSQGQTGVRGFGGDASGIVGVQDSSSPDTKAKGAAAFQNDSQATAEPKISSVVAAEAAALWAIGKTLEKQKQPEAKPPGQLGSKQASGGPLVGPMVGKAIGNPANGSNEDKAAKKERQTLMKPNYANEEAMEGAAKQKRLMEENKTEKAVAAEKAVADSGKSKLKKKGLSSEDKKKAADALGDLSDDGGGRGGTITPGTPNREPPNLQKKPGYAPSDGSGGTISPGTSATPRPKAAGKTMTAAPQRGRPRKR
jgi:hypothetical protein